MIGIVEQRLARPDARRGFVLDGFPRTVPQALALDGMTQDRGPLIVVDIVVPEEELVKRLHSRRICGKCGANAPGPDGVTRCSRCGGALVTRADDDEEVVRQRLKIYLRDTRPLVEFYRQRSSFRSVDGNQPLERVAADLRRAIHSVGGTTTAGRGRDSGASREGGTRPAEADAADSGREGGRP
jgi:adenylate kinase